MYQSHGLTPHTLYDTAIVYPTIKPMVQRDFAVLWPVDLGVAIRPTLLSRLRCFFLIDMVAAREAAREVAR